MSRDIDQNVLEQLRIIGYSDNIELESRSLHIQTEVIPGRNVKIKTIVIESGVVLDSVVQIVEQPEGDIVARTAEKARQQHDVTVNEVVGGKYA